MNKININKISSQEDLNQNLNQMTETLSKAFFYDPYYVYIMPDEKKRSLQLKWWMKIMINYCFKYGLIYKTNDNKGVSLWCGPKIPTLDNVKLALLGLLAYPFKVGIKGFIRMLNVSTEWEKLHLKQNKHHYYLLIIGVDPRFQRKGIGNALIKEILNKADSEKFDCYLETVTNENVLFYQHLDFQIINNEKFDSNQYWTMKRTSRL